MRVTGIVDWYQVSLVIFLVSVGVGRVENDIIVLLIFFKPAAIPVGFGFWF